MYLPVFLSRGVFVHTKEKNRANLPLWLVIVIDVLALGVAINIYALFDHVLIFGTGEVTPIAPVTEPATEPATPSVVPTEPSTEIPTEDEGDFGAKFRDKFAAKGEVTRTEDSYVSHDINVTVTRGRMFNADYYVQDIYVRYADNFRTAFSGGEFNGVRQTGRTIAKDNNAVCAVNGDYSGFGNSQTGVVLRNGLLYRDKRTNDVLVMYKDGSMKTFGIKASFDATQELNSGAWQAWCFGPTIVENGSKITSYYKAIKAKNPRTALGYFEPGHYCFVTVDGRSDTSEGMTMAELAELMESLGCDIAYNLDGGQSSTMIFSDKLINIVPPKEGVRKISDILYIAEIEQE